MKSKNLHRCRRFIAAAIRARLHAELDQLEGEWPDFLGSSQRLIRQAASWGGESYDGLRRLFELRAILGGRS